MTLLSITTLLASYLMISRSINNKHSTQGEIIEVSRTSFRVEGKEESLFTLEKYLRNFNRYDRPILEFTLDEDVDINTLTRVVWASSEVGFADLRFKRNGTDIQEVRIELYDSARLLAKFPSDSNPQGIFFVEGDGTKIGRIGCKVEEGKIDVGGTTYDLVEFERFLVQTRHQLDELLVCIDVKNKDPFEVFWQTAAYASQSRCRVIFYPE